MNRPTLSRVPITFEEAVLWHILTISPKPQSHKMAKESLTAKSRTPR